MNENIVKRVSPAIHAFWLRRNILKGLFFAIVKQLHQNSVIDNMNFQDYNVLSKNHILFLQLFPNIR